jgi:hypothetical protein
MKRVVGLVDNDTGERGWIQYETVPTPIQYMLWFQSKNIDTRVRAYLRTEFEMAVQKHKIKHNPPLIDEGIEWVMVKPTDNLKAFEAALNQMAAEIQVYLERMNED